MKKENQSSITSKERWTISAITAGGVVSYYTHDLANNTPTQTTLFVLAILTIIIFSSVFYNISKKQKV